MAIPLSCETVHADYEGKCCIYLSYKPDISKCEKEEKVLDNQWFANFDQFPT